MSAKPGTPITRKEMYLDVMTGGSSSLPEPITLEEMYLAKIAGMVVDLPTPRYIKHKYLAKIAGMTVNVPTYTMNLPRIYAYLAKAAGQDFEVPQPITREEMYWFDYVNGQPTPSEQEYTGAVPVTFIADGTPLLDYLISGNEEHSGTPTHDSPVMPEGCGERTGNLFDKSTITTNAFAILAGTQENSNYYCSDFIPITAATYYFQNVTGSSIQNSVVVYDINKQGLRYKKVTGGVKVSGKLTFIEGDAYIRINCASTTDVDTVMVNLGSTALPFEPFGVKIPISSANTTTPVYLGEVETARQIKKYVFTGEENGTIYSTGTSRKGIEITGITGIIGGNADIAILAICTHYQPNTRNALYRNTDNGISNAYQNDRIIFYDASCQTVESFQQFCAQQYTAGTPVTVWYVLAEPETAVVNEPLMRIGDYADTLSMEQAGAQIPTANGSTTLDVDTTVKPSEVYIKYKGEPVAGSQTSLQSSAYAPAEVSGQSESVDDINNSLLGKEEETE